MNKGDNYLITYHTMNKTVLAMFLEEENGTYFFEDIHGIFGVSEKKVKSGEITLELVEE